jgi:hypothetical protein
LGSIQKGAGVIKMMLRVAAVIKMLAAQSIFVDIALFLGRIVGAHVETEEDLATVTPPAR